MAGGARVGGAGRGAGVAARGWSGPGRGSGGLPERPGLLVRGGEEEAPAASVGIAEGDLIVSVAGSPVEDPDALLDAIATARPPFAVGIVRGAEERTVTIAPTARPVAERPAPRRSRKGQARG